MGSGVARLPRATLSTHIPYAWIEGACSVFCCHNRRTNGYFQSSNIGIFIAISRLFNHLLFRISVHSHGYLQSSNIDNFIAVSLLRCSLFALLFALCSIESFVDWHVSLVHLSWQRRRRNSKTFNRKGKGSDIMDNGQVKRGTDIMAR